MYLRHGIRFPGRSQCLEHTLEFEGQKLCASINPESGIFQGDKVNVMGNGVVLDPVLFREEAEALAKSGHNLRERLVISRKAHLIMPTHPDYWMRKPMK